MSRKKRKRGRGRVLILVVLLALIVFGVFARGLLTSGRTTTERAQRELDTYAEKNDVSLDAYPEALVQLYARNPDARDFVRDYPKKKDLTDRPQWSCGFGDRAAAAAVGRALGLPGI